MNVLNSKNRATIHQQSLDNSVLYFIPCHLPNLASQARTSVDRAGCQAPPQESYYQHLLTLMEVV